MIVNSVFQFNYSIKYNIDSMIETGHCKKGYLFRSVLIQILTKSETLNGNGIINHVFFL